MDNQKKKILLFLLIGIILVFVVLGAASFLNERFQENSKQPSPVEDITTNWKVYKDKDNYYSFKYPSNWSLKLKQPPTNLHNPGDKKDIILSGPEGEIGILWTDNYGGGCGGNDYEKLKLKNAEVDVCHITNDPNNNGKESWLGIQKELNKTTHIGVFINAYANTPSQVNRNTILKIFSNLELLDQNQVNQTTDWKTYTNKKYGYQIKYPNINTQIVNINDSMTRLLIDAILDSNSPDIKNQTLKDGLQIDILVADSGGSSAKSHLSRHINLSLYEDKISTQRIAGIEAYSIKFRFPDWVQFTEVVKGEKLYEFRISIKGTNQEDRLTLANQILSTFKFLDVTPTPTTKPNVACTQEVKQCPDGSFVGRTGLNCEFAACP